MGTLVKTRLYLQTVTVAERKGLKNTSNVCFICSKFSFEKFALSDQLTLHAIQVVTLFVRPMQNQPLNNRTVLAFNFPTCYIF